MDIEDIPPHKNIDLNLVTSNLNELRDALINLSAKIKDYRASLDWDTHGSSVLEAQDAITKAAGSSKSVT